MSDRILYDKGLVKRHSTIVLIEHWAIAISGLLLVLTGIFQLPIAQRYYITEVPGLTWSGDFIFSLNIHYAASVVFIAACLFHVFYHALLGHKAMLPKKGDIRQSIQVIKSFLGKAEEPPFHKYLPEQRLAYAGMVMIIAGLIISGLVKTYKNIFAPDLSLGILLWATWVHNLLFILFVLAFFAHMAAIVIKPNRPMVRSIFTGNIRLDYARHRHPLWIAELEPPPALPEQTQPETPSREPAGEEEPLQDVSLPEPPDTEEEPAEPAPESEEEHPEPPVKNIGEPDTNHKP
ncbi:MAG TPA: cytochrome b/b6 domain-containing protein [Deltaproteobacteria bacterium]|nr:cytochrome b/b6 domain-containing protein [Deltaproteobacteria bacterium]